MRKIIFSILFAAIVLLGKVEVHAQKSLPNKASCQPSAEEILSVIKSTYNLSPTSDAVVIAGEIRTRHIRIAEEPLLTIRPLEPLTVTRILAMLGGVLKTAKHPFYLIRESTKEKTKTKIEIDLRDIREGRVSDVRIEKGDVLFVPRGCEDGKLLPPTKQTNPKIPGTDYPTGIPNKRDAE